jgi:two-component system, OmpR family, sensor histidine kinase KdpD
MPMALRSTPLSHLAISLFAVTVASGTAMLLDAHVSIAVLAMVYLTAVLLVSYTVSFAASTVTALLAVLALNFLFVPPRGTLTVHATENVLTLAALLGVSLVVSTLATRLRQAVKTAQLREQRAHTLQLLASQLADLDDADRIVAVAQESLQKTTGARVVVALLDSGDLRFPATQRQDAPAPGTVAHDALRHCSTKKESLGPGTGRWNELADWYLPLRAGTQCMGALTLPASTDEGEVQQQAQAVADLLAGALKRAHHAAAAMQARSESEMQQQRNALLAAVSHDFRTPLASIIGAVSSMRSQHTKLTDGDRTALLALIDGEAQHLMTMTENTLQWARLSGPQPGLQADWQSFEEIVGSMLTRVRRRDASRRVQAHVPGGLPLVRADAVLLSQLLENLVDNALKYSEGPVELAVTAHAQALHVDVLDRGPGIAEADLPRIFDTFYRGAQGRSLRGAGLGLAVGRSIAELHRGTLTVAARVGGGSRFRLSLPLQDAPAAAPESPAP